MTLAATKKPSLPGAMAASWVTFDAPAVRPCAVSTCRPGLRLVRGSVAVPSARPLLHLTRPALPGAYLVGPDT